MRIQILVLAVIFTSALGAGLKWSQYVADFYTFEDFVQQYERKYESREEYHKRKSVFESNMEIIRGINSDSTKTWRAGVNHFADRFPEEIESKRGYSKTNSRLSGFNPFKRNLRSVNVEALPRSRDWRQEGVVNPIQNQGACGSCWAFATAATVESHIAIQTGELIKLSEQQLVDCAPNVHKCGGTGGCDGSTQNIGFDYLRQSGAALLSDYPYHARNEECILDQVSIRARIDGFHFIEPNDFNGLLEAVATRGPVTISVDASLWHFYESGILSGHQGNDVNHAVVAVGYGETEQGEKYWIVRNSWGEGWGEEGYLRIAREDNAGDVVCGIDNTPEHGSGCENDVPTVTVCGVSGMYSESSYVLGGRLA